MVSSQRGSLAASLDESLRNLGVAQSELNGHRLRQAGQGARASPLGPALGDSGLPALSPLQPGSWGLLQELHQLHLKLHDGKGPLVGAPPPTVP